MNIRRQIIHSIEQKLEVFPGVLVEGARSVGKSTIVKSYANAKQAQYHDLDQADTLVLAQDSPDLLVAGDELICIDEYQRAPEILQAIKAKFNVTQYVCNQFLLAASTRHRALPKGTQALTGRLARVQVWPLSQSELHSTQPDFIKLAFASKLAAVAARVISNNKPLLRDDYLNLIIAGGFPIAVQISGEANRGMWFDEFVALTLEKDVSELSKIRHSWVLEDLLKRLSTQTANIVSIANISSDIELSATTIQDYFRLLENTFLIHRLPVYTRVRSKRSFKMPKVHFIDTGVAAHLSFLTASKLQEKTAEANTKFGALLETFVINEFCKECSWQTGIKVAGYWRDYDNNEVDLILEDSTGQCIGIEVKASTTYKRTDFTGLRLLKKHLGKSFGAGIVLNLGAVATNPEPDMWVFPVSVIWQA